MRTPTGNAVHVRRSRLRRRHGRPEGGGRIQVRGTPAGLRPSRRRRPAARRSRPDDPDPGIRHRVDHTWRVLSTADSRREPAEVTRPPHWGLARSGDLHAGNQPQSRDPHAGNQPLSGDPTRGSRRCQATPTPGTRQVRRPPRRVPARSGDPHAGNPAPRRGRSPIPCPAGGFVRRRQTSTAPAPVSPRAAFGTTRASPAALSLPLPARRVRIPRCPRCGRSLAGTPLAPAPGR